MKEAGGISFGDSVKDFARKCKGKQGTSLRAYCQFKYTAITSAAANVTAVALRVFLESALINRSSL